MKKVISVTTKFDISKACLPTQFIWLLSDSVMPLDLNAHLENIQSMQKAIDAHFPKMNQKHPKTDESFHYLKRKPLKEKRNLREHQTEKIPIKDNNYYAAVQEALREIQERRSKPQKFLICLSSSKGSFPEKGGRRPHIIGVKNNTIADISPSTRHSGIPNLKSPPQYWQHTTTTYNYPEKTINKACLKLNPNNIAVPYDELRLIDFEPISPPNSIFQDRVWQFSEVI